MIFKIVKDIYEKFPSFMRFDGEDKIKKELLIAKNRYEMIFKNNAAGIYLVDEERNIISVNDRIYEIFGYTEDEIIGMNFSRLHVSQKAYEDFANYYISIENDLKVKVEYQLKRKDGVVIWCELLGNSLLFEECERTFIWSIVDIDERKKAEEENHHLKQLYSTLSQCNQAIVYSNNEIELFSKICKDTAKFSGIKLSWIGVEDKDEGLIKPVAWSGEGRSYLEEITISTNPTIPTGQGPVGIAYREDYPVWIQDFQNNPITVPWRESGKAFNWGSVCALPLHQQGEVVGVFVLYSDKVNMFSDTIRSLLLGMIRDIDYALDGYKKDVTLHQLSQAVEQSSSSIVITDLSSNIVYVNTAFLNITGYTLEEAMGKNPRILNTGKTPSVIFENMWADLLQGKSWRGEFINKRKDGREYTESVSISPLTQMDGTITHYMAIKEDITEKKSAEEYIYRLANFDHLTGLPSRILLEEHFGHVLSLAKRNQNSFALIFLDLDHFKEINDSLGHSIGDALLIDAAKRLQTLMREADIVSRLGGDEFVVILPETTMKGCANVAQKLLDIVSKPYTIEGYELNITVSIGIAFYPDDGNTIELLSKNADIAMYQAKAEGRNNYRFFTKSMQTRSLQNLQLSNALRHAIEKNELEVYFQPQISLTDGSIIGAEALLRWFHPNLGSIPPSVFIPLAEQSGQIMAIGEWVLRTTVRDAKKWQEKGYSDIIFAVNLSAYQFRHPDFPELVSRILSEEEFSSKCLELELTESMAMHNPEEAIDIMNRLHDRGIRLAIDDFGTGYSSLSYLKKFKAYKLKIDQSFVHDIYTDSDDRAIVKAIIMMSKSLGMKTIAEGVETKEQEDYLVQEGCEEVQGYYYSRPMCASDFELFLQNYRK